MRVAIVDLGTNNLGSLCRALRELGAEPSIPAGPGWWEGYTRAILPGVGSFRAGIGALRAQGRDEHLTRFVERGGFLLGICLGMQLLGTSGTEGGDIDGLDLIPGRVERLVPRAGERIPHVGWNEVLRDKESVLLQGVPQGADVYFTHSYHLAQRDEADAIAHTPYAGGFASVVERGRVFGVQFHPEKSSRWGAQVLRNFLETA